MFRLDRAHALDELRRRSRHLVEERPEVLSVRLFGSLARNEAAPGSDADLLLVLSRADDEFRNRGPRYAAYFTGAGIGCDIFAYTEAELAASTASGDAFVSRIVDESIPLAERTAGRRG